MFSSIQLYPQASTKTTEHLYLPLCLFICTRRSWNEWWDIGRLDYNWKRVRFLCYLSARTSKGLAPSDQLRTIQAESIAAKNPLAIPVPIGQNG